MRKPDRYIEKPPPLEVKTAENSLSISDLELVYAKDLTIAIIAARWASDVRRHGATTFRTSLKTLFTPTIRPTAHLAFHLGRSSLWDSHGSSG